MGARYGRMRSDSGRKRRVLEILRKLLTIRGRGAMIGVAGAEELFAPTRYDAREQVEEQRQASAPRPAPTDPPALPPPTGVAGDPGRFTGRVVVRKPSP